jgi:hypothetical protein
MNFKKNLILLILSGIVLSCKTEKDPIVKPESAKPIEYSFVKIEFINPEQSDVSEQYLHPPKVEFSNRTSVTQTYPYNPLSGVYETSQFSGIDSSVINHISNSPIIAVPINIDNFVSLGGAKWPISINPERQESSLNLERTFPVESNKKLTLKTKLHYLKISTDIRLTLIDDKENEEHVFEGSWVGVYPTNAEIEIVFTDL